MIEVKGLFSLKREIIFSALLAVALYASQLFIGMKNYKKHKKQLFKGIYEDIPSPANFRPTSIASKSVHYSGFLVGYMAWGFLICFHLILLIMTGLHFISLQIRYIEVILAVVVPVLVIYLLKMASTSSAGKFLFIHDVDEKLNLTNRKSYAIFVYFNFFAGRNPFVSRAANDVLSSADCFLGIASCIIRLIKATFLNIVYMARLDCSFLGRPLEKFGRNEAHRASKIHLLSRSDLGFAAYVSYLHMEVTHTNPIMLGEWVRWGREHCVCIRLSLAFCYSMYDDVVARRSTQCYDDECCIALSELHEDDATEIKEARRVAQETRRKAQLDRLAASKKRKEKKKTVESDRSSPEKAEVRRDSIPEQPSTDAAAIATDEVSDDEDLSVKEVTPKKKSPSPPTVGSSLNVSTGDSRALLRSGIRQRQPKE